MQELTPNQLQEGGTKFILLGKASDGRVQRDFEGLANLIPIVRKTVDLRTLSLTWMISQMVHLDNGLSTQRRRRRRPGLHGQITG
ncbi:hypothetical protein Scep_007395 [Stephania cephalantha]|uniref:Uncharacterized protein n=1 Tax=Stephania cephalantha TaxID=152367 RepID=A0AAP0KBK4_9MAGN